MRLIAPELRNDVHRPLPMDVEIEENGGPDRTMERTLIVDDSPTMRRMVIASLRDVCLGGFAEAGSGLDALEQLALGPAALMVLDLNMPDMHGLEVLRFVRSHPSFSRLPVIVLTTRGDDVGRRAALDAGASVYLTKPFSPGVLCREAQQLLTVAAPPVDANPR